MTPTTLTEDPASPALARFRLVDRARSAGRALLAADRRYFVGFVAGALAGLAFGVPCAYAIFRFSPDTPAYDTPLPRLRDARIVPLISQGLQALGEKQPARALVAFRKAEKIEPDNADVQNYLCVAFNDLRRFDDAVGACTKAVALRRNFQLAEANLAWARAQRAAEGAPSSTEK
jgi:hypothetical protein